METNKLNGTKKENPFKAPEGYFDRFPQEMMALLPEKEIVEPRVVSLWERVRPWVYMAAMFVGIMLMVNIFVREQDSGDILNDNVADISVSDIDDFYSYYEEKLAFSSYQQLLYSEEEIDSNVNVW